MTLITKGLNPPHLLSAYPLEAFHSTEIFSWNPWAVGKIICLPLLYICTLDNLEIHGLQGK